MSKIFDGLIKSDKRRCNPENNPKKELHNLILVNFPQYYITLVSIIQAAAFGFFLLQLQPDFVDNNGVIRNSIPLIFLCLSTFFVLIEIWYEYMMGALAMKWFPKIFDSIIPFLLGIFEALMILYLGSNNIPGWYVTLSLVCFCSFFAFLNMYRGCNCHYEENKVILESIQDDPNKTLCIILISGFFFLLCGIFEYLYHALTVYIALLSFLIIVTFVIRRHYYWNRILE